MKIAVGNSRMDKKWKNQGPLLGGSLRPLRQHHPHHRNGRRIPQAKKGQQDGIKDVGGFVGGHLREGRRKNGHGAVPLSAHAGYGLRHPDIMGRNYAVPRFQVLRLFHP